MSKAEDFSRCRRLEQVCGMKSREGVKIQDGRLDRWSPGPTVPLQGEILPCLLGELRCHVLCGPAKGENKRYRMKETAAG